MEQSTPECSKTSSPSTAVSRGGWADCGGGGGGVSVGLTSSQEEEDAIDHEEDDARYNNDSSEEVVSEGLKKNRFLPESPIVESNALSPSHDDSNATADANGDMFLPDASAPRASGSSRESSPAIGIHDGCKVSASPAVVPESLTPPLVATQTRESVEGDEVDVPTNERPQRRAARQQRALLGRLIEDDLL